MHRPLTVLAIFAALSVPTFSASDNSSLAAQVDAILAKAVQLSGVSSISVAIVKDGRLAYANAAGRASIEPERKATTETRYAVGSISKQFTSAAILLRRNRERYPSTTRCQNTIQNLLAPARSLFASFSHTHQVTKIMLRKIT